MPGSHQLFAVGVQIGDTGVDRMQAIAKKRDVKQ